MNESLKDYGSRAYKTGMEQDGEDDTKYYVLEIVGDVEPHLHGPYETVDERNDMARTLREEDPCLKNGIYLMDTAPGQDPKVYSINFDIEVD